MEVDGDEGWINSTDVPIEKRNFIVEHNLQLDCMWVIKVKEGWKVISFFSSPFFIILWHQPMF